MELSHDPRAVGSGGLRLLVNRKTQESSTSFMVSLCLHVFILMIISSVWLVGNRSHSILLQAHVAQAEVLDQQSVEIVFEPTENVLESEPVEVLQEQLADWESPSVELTEYVEVLQQGTDWTDAQVSEPLKREASPASYQGASFFGIPPSGDRIVYIIDMSPSMLVGKYQTRYARAVNEVIEAVQQLREDQQFFVIMFSFKTIKIKLDNSRDFCFANEPNIEALKKRLRNISVSSGTDPREAIVEALKIKPTCIYLLSDGEFNGNQLRNGIYGSRITALELSKKHNSNRCPIHTIGLEDPRTQQELTEIAEASGGTHVFIPPED